eukprot:5780030-Prymnesium_polylepis.1
MRRRYILTDRSGENPQAARSAASVTSARPPVEPPRIGARGLRPQLIRSILKNQNLKSVLTAMASSESSRRDLLIEHDFIFGNTGPPAGDTPLVLRFHIWCAPLR